MSDEKRYKASMEYNGESSSSLFNFDSHPATEKRYAMTQKSQNNNIQGDALNFELNATTFNLNRKNIYKTLLNEYTGFAFDIDERIRTQFLSTIYFPEDTVFLRQLIRSLAEYTLANPKNRSKPFLVNYYAQNINTKDLRTFISSYLISPARANEIRDTIFSANSRRTLFRTYKEALAFYTDRAKQYQCKECLLYGTLPITDNQYRKQELKLLFDTTDVKHPYYTFFKNTTSSTPITQNNGKTLVVILEGSSAQYNPDSLKYIFKIPRNYKAIYSSISKYFAFEPNVKVLFSNELKHNNLSLYPYIVEKFNALNEKYSSKNCSESEYDCFVRMHPEIIQMLEDFECSNLILVDMVLFYRQRGNSNNVKETFSLRTLYYDPSLNQHSSNVQLMKSEYAIEKIYLKPEKHIKKLDKAMKELRTNALMVRR